MKKENEIKDKIDNNSTTQKKNPTPFEITVLVLFIIFIIYGSFNRDKISNFFNNEEQTKQTELKEIDKTFVIYDENNLLVKITDYKFGKYIDSVEVTFYIENNSDVETTFSINGDVSINDYMMDGGYLYETIKPHSKYTKDVSIYYLDKYKLNKNNIKNLKFNFDIYHSDRYLIKDRILDNQEFIYTFNK